MTKWARIDEDDRAIEIITVDPDENYANPSEWYSTELDVQLGWRWAGTDFVADTFPAPPVADMITSAFFGLHPDQTVIEARVKFDNSDVTEYNDMVTDYNDFETEFTP